MCTWPSTVVWLITTLSSVDKDLVLQPHAYYSDLKCRGEQLVMSRLFLCSPVQVRTCLKQGQALKSQTESALLSNHSTQLILYIASAHITLLPYFSVPSLFNKCLKLSS